MVRRAPKKLADCSTQRNTAVDQQTNDPTVNSIHDFFSSLVHSDAAFFANAISVPTGLGVFPSEVAEARFVQCHGKG
jgi:hypothetical protein